MNKMSSSRKSNKRGTVRVNKQHTVPVRELKIEGQSRFINPAIPRTPITRESFVHKQ